MSDQAPVLARDGNTAIVQLPGRAFPAIALQGDTFEGQLAFYERTLLDNKFSLPYVRREV